MAVILLGGDAISNPALPIAGNDGPAVIPIGLTCVGICVAGSRLVISVPVIESVPGDAVISCEPQMGHTISAHEVFAG